MPLRLTLRASHLPVWLRKTEKTQAPKRKGRRSAPFPYCNEVPIDQNLNTTVALTVRGAPIWTLGVEP